MDHLALSEIPDHGLITRHGRNPCRLFLKLKASGEGFVLLTKKPWVRFSAFPRISPIIFDVAEINRQHFLEWGKA